ncbi:hypothetical protein QN277_009804 [Acacia crassicarpa]|uniref:Uncharacterized protein n=1 Tax=Acacia crassicarpa TaxID=499986 RepID=A0AAE1IPR9_9FABA|nr:hypothetical protein QN277_009804 [Acacia crassicarpa]
MADESVVVARPPSLSAAAPLGSSVISLVNRLQDIFARVGKHSSINLPQVAVVGCQSCGKSSVYGEFLNLNGKKFYDTGFHLHHSYY